MSGDLVHRCRFVDYNPQAITALKFSPSGNVLTVAKNQEIEIRTKPKFFVSNVLNTSFKVNQLIFTAENSLVASGVGGLIFIDLNTFEQNKLNLGPVWCVSIFSDLLACGSNDGLIILKEGDVLKRIYSNGHVLACEYNDRGDLAFGNNKAEITVISENSDRVLLRAFGEIRSLKWFCGYLASGDSSGSLCFWDVKVGALVHRFDSHCADILALTVKGNSLFASGIDYAVVQVAFSAETNTFAFVEKLRYHSNDVLAMDLWGDLLVSGGVEGSIKLRRLNSKSLKTLSCLPEVPIISLCMASRRIIARFEKHVKVWTLGTALKRGQNISQASSYKQSMQLNFDDVLICSAINQKFVAVSSIIETKLFEIGKSSLNLVFSSKPCSQMRFVGNVLVLGCFDHELRFINLEDFEIKAEFSQDFNVKEITACPDAKSVVILNTNNELFLYDLQEGPKFVKKLLAFRDMACLYLDDRKHLFIGTLDHRFFVINVELNSLTVWSKLHSFNMQTHFSRPVGIFYHKNRTYMWSCEGCTVVDMTNKKPTVFDKKYSSLLFFGLASKNEFVAIERPLKEINLPPPLDLKKFSKK